MDSLGAIRSYIDYRYAQKFARGGYYIVSTQVLFGMCKQLCVKCVIEPRKSGLSIVSGDDYGIPRGLPKLNDVGGK